MIRPTKAAENSAVQDMPAVPGRGPMKQICICVLMYTQTDGDACMPIHARHCMHWFPHVYICVHACVRACVCACVRANVHAEASHQGSQQRQGGPSAMCRCVGFHPWR